MEKWSSPLTSQWEIFSIKWQNGRWFQLKFLLTLCLSSQLIPRNILSSFTDFFQQLAQNSLLFWKGCRKKAEWGDPCLCLKIHFSPGHQLRVNKNKKANIANSAHFFISVDLKILWNYWAENHSYNKVEMIPSGKTGQLYHYCCRAESSERPLHRQLSNYKDSDCTPGNNHP